VRKPDASFVARGRFTDGVIPKGDVGFAPDLAVEVVSPNDFYDEIDVKVSEYLGAGVRLVWIVSPATKTVLVRRPDKTCAALDVSDTLSGEEVLPGFTCAVAELFG
jgi:Uma2 family endonuclease